MTCRFYNHGRVEAIRLRVSKLVRGFPNVTQRVEPATWCQHKVKSTQSTVCPLSTLIEAFFTFKWGQDVSSRLRLVDSSPLLKLD